MFDITLSGLNGARLDQKWYWLEIVKHPIPAELAHLPYHTNQCVLKHPWILHASAEFKLCLEKKLGPIADAHFIELISDIYSGKYIATVIYSCVFAFLCASTFIDTYTIQ
jgi:hypothetical protein